MWQYHCSTCGEKVSLSDDEKEVFTYHKLLNFNKLSKCPFCIEETLRAPIRRDSPRILGSGLAFHELGGFYSNGGTGEAIVHPKKKK